MPDGTGTRVAIACQGSGSYTAFTAGVLREVLRELPDGFEIGALSGVSDGAVCAALAWDGLRRGDIEGAIDRLEGFWSDVVAETLWERAVNNTALLRTRLAADVLPFGGNPYRHCESVLGQRELREAIERYVRFDDDTPSSPPHLFVGGVGVESGSFEVFVDGEAGTAALLASATVASVHGAAEDDGPGHRDGRFSQNPPISPFFSEVPPEEKPDEIWIVQLSPWDTDEAPRTPYEMANRRIELAWHLSLDQDLSTIVDINDLIDRGVVNDERYRSVEVRLMELELALSDQLKRNRSREFLEDLMRLGESRARELLEYVVEHR